LLDAESIEKAVQGCDYVVHCASPVPFKQPEDEMEVIRPAVEGTLAVLRAAHKHKVKRVVVTSSGLTIYQRKPENVKELYTEEDWSDVEVCVPYDKSKLLAEKAAWEFVNNLPEDEKFELVVIIPGIVLGPNIVTGDFYSATNIKMMLLGLMPALPQVKIPIVDVRNVAEAHLNAIKVPEARNQRFVLISRTFRFKEVCEILKEQYGEKYPIKLNEMEQCPPDNQRFKNNWNRNYNVVNTKSQEILGIRYYDIKDTLFSMIETMIEHGMLPDYRDK
jgi:nucleoside-diphosphate-sugar epimerase